MNVKQSLDILMARLGGRTSPELRAMALQEMALFQETECEGAEELPWFIITERAEADTEVGESRIPLPPDFIREVEDEDLLLVDEEGNENVLPKVTPQEAEFSFRNAEPGTPQVYVIKGNYIFLYPAPDRILTVRFPSYYARQEAPIDSEDSENGWFKHASDVMMYGAGVIMATLHLKDPDLVTLMTTLLARAQTRLRNAITAREEANKSRRMG